MSFDEVIKKNEETKKREAEDRRIRNESIKYQNRLIPKKPIPPTTTNPPPASMHGYWDSAIRTSGRAEQDARMRNEASRDVGNVRQTEQGFT